MNPTPYRPPRAGENLSPFAKPEKAQAKEEGATKRKASKKKATKKKVTKK
jgi:hypothetical protein